MTASGTFQPYRLTRLRAAYGYLRDHPIERILRVHQILEGTNEIMRVIVSRDLLGN